MPSRHVFAPLSVRLCPDCEPKLERFRLVPREELPPSIVARHPSMDRGAHVQLLTRNFFGGSDCEHGFMNRVSGPTMRHSWNMLERVLCMVLYVIVHYPLSQASDLHVLPHFDCTNSKVSLLLMPFDTTVDGCE